MVLVLSLRSKSLSIGPPTEVRLHIPILFSGCRSIGHSRTWNASSGPNPPSLENSGVNQVQILPYYYFFFHKNENPQYEKFRWSLINWFVNLFPIVQMRRAGEAYNPPENVHAAIGCHLVTGGIKRPTYSGYCSSSCQTDNCYQGNPKFLVG